MYFLKIVRFIPFQGTIRPATPNNSSRESNNTNRKFEIEAAYL